MNRPTVAAIGALLLRLVLELGHPARLAEPGESSTGQPRVLRDVGLHEDRRAVQAERERLRGRPPGPLPQRGRVVLDGDRVHVGDEVERVVVVLKDHPLADRAQVVAQVERVRGGLDAGQQPWSAVEDRNGHAPILPSVRSVPVDEPLVITLAAGPVGLGARSWPGDSAQPTARPVLLVHGLSSNARLWDGVAAWLAEDGHPVVAVDLRGHGSSAEVPDPTDGPGATLVAAADLAAVCVGLGWRSPIVVGQSWGGNVVLQLATRTTPSWCTGWRSSTAAGCTSATGGPRSTPHGWHSRLPCSTG